ncbi:MAG: aldo/keto reductase [Candidatus Micrarchaeia archaeon]
MKIEDFKVLGDTNEKISALGIGTWKLGINPKAEIEAIQTAINSGINFIDTAEIYGTEELVGKAIRGLRDDLFIATKVWTNHFHYDDVIKACEGSLRRLNTDYIDLYQLHWPNPEVPIEETMKAMEKLLDEGKIRYIGVSNFSVEQFQEAQKVCSKKIVSNQVKYNITVKDIEYDLLPFSEKEKISIIAYSPLGSGELFSQRNKALLSKLAEIGKKYNKTAVQVALNFLISHETVIAIPKAGNKEHVLENIGAMEWRLDKEDIKHIDNLL